MISGQKFIRDTVNIASRLRIADCLVGRPDIRDHAATLIALQDGEIEIVDVTLSRKERALGRYIGLLMGNRSYPEDEMIPVGVKLPQMYPSPLFHLSHAIRADRWGHEATAHVPHLPRSVCEIEEHLHESMEGVFRNDAENSHAFCKVADNFSAISEDQRFEEVTGTTIQAIAQFLEAIRREHPVMFLLLLSFELEEALRVMPSLAYRGGENPMRQWRDKFFGNARCSIYVLFEVTRILKRGTAIISHLSSRTHFTVSRIRRLASRLRQGQVSDADGNLLKHLNLTTFTLRKNILIDIDRHHEVAGEAGRYRFARRATGYGTFSAFACLTGADRAYSAEVVDDWIENFVLNLPVAGPAPAVSPKSNAIEVDRIEGAGKNQEESLATYYGLTGKELAIVVAHEVGAVMGSKTSVRLIARLADTIAQKLWTGGTIRSEQVAYMRKSIDYVFPPVGSFRHSCGFAASSWSNLEQDAANWEALAKWGRTNGKGNSFAELFVKTRRYLQGWSYGTARLANTGPAARIFGHLSRACGLLADDPIWIKLLHRQRFIEGINAKNKTVGPNRSDIFGTGPKSMNELLDLVA